MNNSPKTTNIFVDTKDYFAGDLDDGGVRVGLYNSVSFNIPRDHKYYSDIKKCKTSDECEIIFDQLIEDNS